MYIQNNVLNNNISKLMQEQRFLVNQNYIIKYLMWL
jgi:hypothetical protein